jgi:hypothetical protein
MIGWRYTLTDGAWHSRDPSSSGVEGVAPSYLAAKKAILRDLREKFPRSGEARVSVQGREPGITYFEITGPQYAGVGALMEMEAEDVAQLVSGWGAEPAPLSQANPRARDNLLVATAAALVGVPAAQATAAVVGRVIAVNLGRAAYVAFLKMTPDERAEWMETQGTRFAWFRKPFQRFINEDRQSSRQTRHRKLYKGVARAFDNKKVQAAIEKGIAKEESKYATGKTRKNPQARDPRARDNFFWGKSEKTASKPSTPRLSYVQSMHLAEAMAADAKQRLALRHGWKGYFLVKMPKVRGSGHVWFYLSSVTLREMGRASVYGAPQTKITASNPWAAVLRNLDAIRDPSGYQIVELDTLTGKVTGPLSYPQVQDRSGVKAAANPRISDVEIQRKAQFYIDSFWEYADKYGWQEARGWLQDGHFQAFRVWMRIHPNTKHLSPMLRSTRRHHFRNWNQHDFEKLLGRVAAGTRPESKTNPKKKRRKAKRRNVHHEDALSRKTTRGHKRKERKRSVAKGHSRKPKHKGQAKLNPVQDLKAQVHDFAERLRSWNLKYDEFPDIRAWVTQNWTAPYGADAALDYLNGVAERRSESYWGQSTRSRQDIADEAERSRRLRAVYSDLAGDEVRQNPRLTRRPQAPYVWEENIYKNGKLDETVYYSDLRDFFRDIERASPGGNPQIHDNWQEGRARASTSYTDGAGNIWDLYFSKMRGTGARMNPKSGHHGSAGRYYEPRTDSEAREYLSKLTDLLPAARFQSVIEELEEVAGGLNRWAQAKAYLIGAGEDRYLQKVYDSFGLYDLRENSCGCRHNPCPHERRRDSLGRFA